MQTKHFQTLITLHSTVKIYTFPVTVQRTKYQYPRFYFYHIFKTSPCLLTLSQSSHSVTFCETSESTITADILVLKTAVCKIYDRHEQNFI